MAEGDRSMRISLCVCLGLMLLALVAASCGDDSTATYDDFHAAGWRDGVSIADCSLHEEDNCNLYIGRSRNGIAIGDRDPGVAATTYDSAFDGGIPALWACAERYGFAQRSDASTGSGWHSLWSGRFHERSAYAGYEACKSDLVD